MSNFPTIQLYMITQSQVLPSWFPAQLAPFSKQIIQTKCIWIHKPYTCTLSFPQNLSGFTLISSNNSKTLILTQRVWIHDPHTLSYYHH